jgi:hypothetical protein
VGSSNVYGAGSPDQPIKIGEEDYARLRGVISQGSRFTRTKSKILNSRGLYSYKTSIVNRSQSIQACGSLGSCIFKQMRRPQKQKPASAMAETRATDNLKLRPGRQNWITRVREHRESNSGDTGDLTCFKKYSIARVFATLQEEREFTL